MTRCASIGAAILLALLTTLAAAGPLRAALLSFDQLNWFGTATSTPNSAWGRVNIQFDGFDSTRYFNLNVGGRWVIQNMTVASFFGSGTNQAASTTFDLGVPNGTRVPSLDYAFAITDTALLAAPSARLTTAAVSSVDYQIGGDDSIDTGSPGPPGIDTRGGPVTVAAGGAIPHPENFINQPQGVNDCVRASVSNSLGYLRRSGKISFTETMDQVQAWSGIKPDRSTPSGWVQKKIDHLTPLGMTVRRIGAPLTNAKLADLIAELNDGQDIEMVFEGHVVDLVGLRRLSDGNVDFDVFDDNQRDGNVADPMRTARLGLAQGPGGLFQTVGGLKLIECVVECPEPTSAVTVAGAALLSLRRREGRGSRRARRG